MGSHARATQTVQMCSTIKVGTQAVESNAFRCLMVSRVSPCCQVPVFCYGQEVIQDLQPKGGCQCNSHRCGGMVSGIGRSMGDLSGELITRHVATTLVQPTIAL